MKSNGNIQPAPIIAPVPLFAMAAPAYPPIRAWDELEGIPKNHVMRFHAMAAIRAAAITANVTASPSTTSDPIVVATATPKRNGPIK